MDELPAADRPSDAPTERPHRPVTRRALLAGGGFVVAVAGAAGAAVGALGTSRPPGRAQAPSELVQALTAEVQLVAAIDASIAADPALRAELSPVRADHAGHAAALRALIAQFPATATEPAAGAATALDRAGLRVAEQTAAARAAGRAAVLRGRTAALLASIAACEASHAELLS